MTVSVVLLMFALVIPAAREIVNKTRSDNVVVDLEKIQTDISDFMLINRRLPDSLTEIYGDIPRDPWGNEFNYLNIADGDETVKFKVRKYKFIKNLNTVIPRLSQEIMKVWIILSITHFCTIRYW